MKNKIEIYQTVSGNEVYVQLENDTVWLNRQQLALLFERDIKTIGKHVNNVFKEGELDSNSVVAKFATTAQDSKTYQVEYYNLDVIISVGYRVKSAQGVKFRQWATALLKDYLVRGYAINEKRLQQKQQEIEILKTGLRIVSRAIEKVENSEEQAVFRQFAKGLALLDDYDHEALDQKGLTQKTAIYPEYKDYMALIGNMYSDFESNVFAKPKDDSFHSSINQIRQSFGEVELYPSIEEKAANLLYFITKNHSFVDGNKRMQRLVFCIFCNKTRLYTTIKMKLL